MSSYQDNRRQLRVALIAISIVLPLGVIGYIVIEKVSLLDAIWITVTTLTTIGYGDIVAKSETGRLFTIFLVIIGLGSFAILAQASIAVVFSPDWIRASERRAERRIKKLRQHYVICGEGELVDKSITYLLQRVQARRKSERLKVEQRYSQLTQTIRKLPIITRAIQFIGSNLTLMRSRQSTLLEIVVVITQDEDYAARLRQMGLWVIEGDSTSEEVLLRAGIDKARALMVMRATDTETLLTVLTANNYNPNLYITAATLEDKFSKKMLRVGANNVVGPLDVAGQFLNNATFRPAVNDFFNTVLFDQEQNSPQVVQLFLHDDSEWIGKTLKELEIRKKYDASVLGIRKDDGNFAYAPGEQYRLKEDEVVLITARFENIPAILKSYRGEREHKNHPIIWQPLPINRDPIYTPKTYSLLEAEAESTRLSHHYIICDGGPVAHTAIRRLNPERAFVIISNEGQETSELLRKGFRVIHGSPIEEETLIKAGIKKALAIMIATGDGATNVLTTLTSRTLNREILITATADNDEMVTKLYRAGADRVISPFRIAAQFVLLATTRPVVSDFMQYVLYNHHVSLETTELYMQDDSSWIGKSVGELNLWEEFEAGIIGIRLADGSFIYAPDPSHRIEEYQILIVTTPMKSADKLRDMAHGSETKRPNTIRHEYISKLATWERF